MWLREGGRRSVNQLPDDPPRNFIEPFAFTGAVMLRRPGSFGVDGLGPLKAPFPAFGGKSRIADEVWRRFGVVTGPGPGGSFGIETINDRNAFVANFWRAVQVDPERVAFYADSPVNETDLHARHRWLVGSDQANRQLQKVRDDPTFFDAKIAGWWCWGACCWIGSGWCDESSGRWKTEDSMHVEMFRGKGVHKTVQQISDSRGIVSNQIPHMDGSGRPLITGPSNQLPMLGGDGSSGRGVHSPGSKRVKLTGNGVGVGVGVHKNCPSDLATDSHAKRPRQAAFDQPGLGVNAPAQKMPHADQAGRLIVSPPSADVEKTGIWKQLPFLSRPGQGVTLPIVVGVDDSHRPQLADAFSRGRGVNGNDSASSCQARRQWITAWMYALADRLRAVRVCCGHWSRVCDSPSTMTRLGLTAVFLDPPYRISLGNGKANRSKHIYANDRHQDVNGLCDEVQEWCLRWSIDPLVRIALCGLEGEYPEIQKLVTPGGVDGGWDCFEWKSNGGYGNRGGGAENLNAARERVWFSPACRNSPAEKSQMEMFA